ncbi:sulfatase, partial [Paenibacillus sepulcri]|nr:sulfatase [Paenibacillus sepulcri]
QNLELAEPFSFTKGVKTLRIPARTYGNLHAYGTLLYDVQTDPQQREPIADAAVEARMVGLLTELMRENEAPEEQYARLGLPVRGRE